MLRVVPSNVEGRGRAAPELTLGDEVIGLFGIPEAVGTLDRPASEASLGSPAGPRRIVSMGLTHVTTTIRRLAGRGKAYTADFLVDTGAIDCLAPAKALHKAGIRVEGKKISELADGTPIELEYGFARVSLMGEKPSRRLCSDRTNQNRCSGFWRWKAWALPSIRKRGPSNENTPAL